MPLPEPYYQDQYVTLYCGDNVALHKTWENADILITDPPYGIKWEGARRKRRKIVGDTNLKSRDRMLAFWNLDKPSLIFDTWRNGPMQGEHQPLIWYKTKTVGMGDLKQPFGPNYEIIHRLGNGWDITVTGMKRTGSVIATNEIRGGGLHQSGYMPTRVDGEENQTGHPTPKPVHLMETLISYCPPGLITDPFAGTGATLIAARNLHRHAVGVEIEETFCKTIVERLTAKPQSTLI